MSSIDEYARAIAIATRKVMNENGQVWIALYDEQLDAIIASVPKPEAQHHDSPTCDGWWWAHDEYGWNVVQLTTDSRGGTKRVWCAGAEVECDPTDFDRWVGPLQPPDTTTPAPDVQAQVILDCGDNSCRFATNKGGMRTNGRCRCFENAGFGPSAVGAALKMLPEIARLRAQLAQIDATRGQTEKSLTDYLDRARDDEYQRIDAAVARERERIIELVEIKRAKFNIGTRASLALSDVLDQIRARSGAKKG
jgi:hypothetical protein